MLDVREYLKPAIERSGLKQFVVARRMGLEPQQLTDVIGKRRRLEANELLSFCQIVGITPSELCTTNADESKKGEENR